MRGGLPGHTGPRGKCQVLVKRQKLAWIIGVVSNCLVPGPRMVPGQEKYYLGMRELGKGSHWRFSLRVGQFAYKTYIPRQLVIIF